MYVIDTIISKLTQWKNSRHDIVFIINIHKILNYCKNSAKNSYGNEIIFEEIYDPSLPDFSSNEELLIQIFTNLIKNGCEAQNNKGKIILKTSYNANKKFLLNENDLPEVKPLQVEVIDYGTGISDDEIQNIFDILNQIS